MLKNIALPLLFVFSFILLAILYLNRDSPKLWEAMPVSIGVLLAAFFYVTQDQPIERQITPIYFLVKKQNYVPFFPDYSVLRKYYIQQELIFGDYLKHKGESTIDFSEDHKAMVDFHAIAVLHHLLNWYHHEWNVKKETRVLPGGTETIGGEAVEKRRKNDIVEIDKNQLQEVFKENIFYEHTILPVFKSLALPKNTNIFYTRPTQSPTIWEFRIVKPNNFNIKIRISFSSMGIGLGKVGHYIGLTDPEQEYVVTSDPNVRNYQSVALRMKCEASFPRYKAWNPTIRLYKNWVNRLFDDLHDAFDWYVCENKIKDHQAFLANQRIIRGSK
jgi:hypothetical protein